MPRHLPEIESTYIDADGRNVTVYASNPARRETQLLRTGSQRKSGRKTQTAQRCGVGSWKGCK